MRSVVSRRRRMKWCVLKVLDSIWFVSQRGFPSRQSTRQRPNLVPQGFRGFDCFQNTDIHGHFSYTLFSVACIHSSFDRTFVTPYPRSCFSMIGSFNTLSVNRPWIPTECIYDLNERSNLASSVSQSPWYQYSALRSWNAPVIDLIVIVPQALPKVTEIYQCFPAPH